MNIFHVFPPQGTMMYEVIGTEAAPSFFFVGSNGQIFTRGNLRTDKALTYRVRSCFFIDTSTTCLTYHLNRHLIKKGRRLHIAKTHNIIYANEKAESFAFVAALIFIQSFCQYASCHKIGTVVLSISTPKTLQ